MLVRAYGVVGAGMGYGVVGYGYGVLLGNGVRVLGHGYGYCTTPCTPGTGPPSHCTRVLAHPPTVPGLWDTPLYPGYGTPHCTRAKANPTPLYPG